MENFSEGVVGGVGVEVKQESEKPRTELVLSRWVSAVYLLLDGRPDIEGPDDGSHGLGLAHGCQAGYSSSYH